MRILKLTGYLLIVVIAAGLLAWLYLHQSLPETKDVLVIDGLDSEVNIVRDDHGVPRVFAKTDRDAFFTMGYLHAQERLWQLELQRRMGSGRLSEILGEEALDIDRYARTMGFYKSASSTWHHLGEQAQTSLVAYTEGINQWLKEGHTLPPEFLIVQLTPEPWTVEDSLVGVKTMAFSMSRNYYFEKIRYQLLKLISNERIQILLQTESDPSLFFNSFSAINNIANHSLTSPQSPVANRYFSNERFNGSNAWVISGQHTESGLPILANDPHLTTQNPSPWYLAEIQGDQLHVTGATLVGLPIVIVGRNTDVAWGLTASQADVMDFYLERINDKNQYKFNGVWEDMDIREELIHIRGKDQPELLQVRHTRHGPLLSDVDSDFSTPVSVRWSTLESIDTTYDSHLRLNYAKNWSEFKNTLRDYTGIPLKLLYADRHGTIASRFVGNIPIRKKGDGAAPVPGWNADYDWKGWIPFDEIPEQLNPPEGFLVAANDFIPEENSPHLIAIDWALPYRARRVKELITQQIEVGRPFTVNDMRAIQGDVKDIMSRKLLPYLRQLTPANKQQDQAIAYLKDWTGDSTHDSIATSIYTIWVSKLVDRILQDELEGVAPADMVWFQAVFIDNIMNTKDDLWCDNTLTSTIESCQDMMSLALDDALEQLTTYLGKDMSNWQWGAIHKIQYQHTPFSYIPILRHFFHREIGTDGSHYTVNVGYPSPSRDYKNTWAPVYRQIIDFDESSTDLFMIAPGQSGNPLSKHFDDLVEAHRNLDYINMSFGIKNASGTRQLLLATPP